MNNCYNKSPWCAFDKLFIGQEVVPRQSHSPSASLIRVSYKRGCIARGEGAGGLFSLLFACTLVGTKLWAQVCFGRRSPTNS